MRNSERFPKNYLSSDALKDGDLTVTIDHLSTVIFNEDDSTRQTQEKVVLHFREDDVKPMVLNTTNHQLIAIALNEEDDDKWAGRKIVLWHDASISMGGKLVGGTRVKKAPETGPVVLETAGGPVDQIPFAKP